MFNTDRAHPGTNQLLIKYTRILGDEALLNKITIPLKYNNIHDTFSIEITAQALTDLVHLAQSKGINMELKSI